MEIVNTIGWRTPWLKRVVAYCCKELEYPIDRLRKATFKKAENSEYQGWADLEPHEIRVKINPTNRYPVLSSGNRDLSPIPQADAVEVLVRVTAHEIAHLERWDRFAREWKR
jgi:hypothetical protein